MKQLLLLLFPLSVMTLSAEESLKREVIGLLEVVLKESEGIPEGYSVEALYEEMSEDLDFTLNAEQAGQLAGGKTLHTIAQRAKLLEQCDQLKEIGGPLFGGSLIRTLKDDAAAAREREAAYQLLDALNQQKVVCLNLINLNSARQLQVRLLVDGAKLTQDEANLFEGLNGKRKWLFNFDGYGELEKGEDDSQVIILSPEAVMDELVLICKDGSGHIKTVAEVKDRVDLSQVHMPGKK